MDLFLLQPFLLERMWQWILVHMASLEIFSSSLQYEVVSPGKGDQESEVIINWMCQCSSDMVSGDQGHCEILDE